MNLSITTSKVGGGDVELTFVFVVVRCSYVKYIKCCPFFSSFPFIWVFLLFSEVLFFLSLFFLLRMSQFDVLLLFVVTLSTPPYVLVYTIPLNLPLVRVQTVLRWEAARYIYTYINFVLHHRHHFSLLPSTRHDCNLTSYALYIFLLLTIHCSLDSTPLSVVASCLFFFFVPVLD